MSKFVFGGEIRRTGFRFLALRLGRRRTIDKSATMKGRTGILWVKGRGKKLIRMSCEVGVVQNVSFNDVRVPPSGWMRRTRYHMTRTA